MKKVLSLFVVLSMLFTVLPANTILADNPIVDLTVPNGNFANQTSAENGTLPDGWQVKLYANSTLAVNNLCYAIGAYEGGTCPNSTLGTTASDGSYSLMIKHPSGSASGHLMIESPKLSLGSALTEKAEVTFAYDFKRGNAGQAIQAVIFFHNEEGKVYNDGAWVDAVVTPTADTSWHFKDADGNNNYISDTTSSTGQWLGNSFQAVAPAGTTDVSVAFVSSSSGAIRMWLDNVKVSYQLVAAAASLQPVTNLQASAGNKQVTLSWNLPADTTDYAGVKIAVKNGTTPVKEIFVEDALQTSTTVTGLENGVNYTFEVQSMNQGRTEFAEAAAASATPIAPMAGIVTIPNANFENTVAVNKPLVDGWAYQLYVNPEDSLLENMLYYAMSTEAGNGGSASGSNSLVMKCPGKGNYEAGTGLMVLSPVVSLSEALTEETEFTYAFDYKCIAQNFNTAILFYNAEGKVYNGTEWIDFAVEKDDDWKFADASGQNAYSTIGAASDNKNKWLSSQIVTNAPVGTAGVRVIAVATGGGANKFAIDNLSVTYGVQESAPNPVTNLQASAGNKQVTLSWNLPADTTNYAGVKISVKNGTTPVKEVLVEDALQTSATVTGLENDVNYTFEVQSMNQDKTEFAEAATANATPVDSSSSESGTVIIPNANFENTVAVNQPLVDGWSYQLYVNPEDSLAENMLYYAMNTEAGNGTSVSGSSSLVMKCPGKGTYEAGTGLMVLSPIVSLSNVLSADTQFTYTFDYKCIAQNFNTAILFYNAEGKVYNGTEWIDFVVEKDADWKFTDKNGQDGYITIATGDNKNKWLSSQIVTDAPAGTAGARVIAVATGGGANKFAIDNLNVIYGEAPVITTPNPVTNLKAVAGDKQVTLSWELPKVTANYAGVKITVKSGSNTVSTLYAEGKDTVSQTVTGLTNGTEYTFEVQSMNQDKTEFAEAVRITAIPHVIGVLPVKNQIADRSIYMDDYEMSIDLNILSEGALPSDAAELAYYNAIVNATNIFESQGKTLTFTSDTPGVSFRDVPYGLGVKADGSKVQFVVKQQLVYKPSEATVQPITVNVTGDDGAGSTGTVSFKLTVKAPPESEKPVEDPSSMTAYLYVPNADFDRTSELVPYNKDLSGGWHPVIWGNASGRLGDNQLCYRTIKDGDGNSVEIKAPSAGSTNLMIQSAFIATPDTQQRDYTYSLSYKNGAEKPNFAMFFFNEQKEVFMGFDGSGETVWKAEPTGADLWGSVDANGKAPYEKSGNPSGYTAFSMTRTAPAGTAFIKVAIAATGSNAYRYQADSVRLTYLKNEAPVIIGENPMAATISLGESMKVTLKDVFAEPDGDEMTYTAEAGKGTVENGIYAYTPNKIGSQTVSVTAADPYGAKATLKINLTVNDAVSTSIVNMDIKPVTKAMVNGSVTLKKADGSNVTSLSQLNAGDTLKVNVSLKNTSELPVTTTLIIVKYDANGVVESVTTKVIVIPSTGGDPDYTTVRDYVVENNSGSVEVMLWDSATNLNSLIDPIRI